VSSSPDASSASPDLLGVPHRPLAARLLNAQETWIAIAILALGAVVSMISGKFATPGNLLNVFQNACFIGLMALGMTPIIISGGIDISVGSILGLCGVTYGIVLNADMPLGVGIVSVLVLGALCGAFNGMVITFFKLPPFVVTLATR
jgi:ribose transport system permease protein